MQILKNKKARNIALEISALIGFIATFLSINSYRDVEKIIFIIESPITFIIIFALSVIIIFSVFEYALNKSTPIRIILALISSITFLILYNILHKIILEFLQFNFNIVATGYLNFSPSDVIYNVSNLSTQIILVLLLIIIPSIILVFLKIRNKKIDVSLFIILIILLPVPALTIAYPYIYSLDCINSQKNNSEFTCVINIGRNFRNVRVCNVFKEDIEVFNNCRYNININESIKDIEKNNKIITEKIDDYNQKIQKGNCDEIEFESYKDQCLLKNAVEFGDSELCFSVTSISNKEECFRKIALKNLNLNICNEIGNEKIKKECTYDIYIKLAKTSQDVKICDNIDDEKFKNACISSV